MQGNVNIPDSTITTNLSFRQLVLMNMQQLTNFPYIEKDFDALTDYELLCLVVKFLNDVIANQNEQNNSITRMYQSFLALQDYVNNTKDTLEDAFNNLDNYVRYYFDNLDVQEEINNKLDQMLEDGVLEQIIEQFIQSTAIWCFDTVADMKQATNLIDGSYARTLGYYSLNDGGGATYKITDTESQTEYQEEISNNLYATLIVDDIIYLKKFGIYNNISTTEYNNKINKIKIIADNNDYIIKDNILTLLDNTSFLGLKIDIQQIILNNNDLELGGSTGRQITTGYHDNTQSIFEIKKISNDTGKVYIRGCHGIHLNIGNASEINFRTNNINEYIAYSTFNFKYVETINIEMDDNNPDGTINDKTVANGNWINENKFILNRCVKFNVDVHFNHNLINGGCFEGNYEITLKEATGNIFEFMRFESTSTSNPKISFDSKSNGNIFYKGITNYRLKVSDNGINNKIINKYYESKQLIVNDYVSLQDIVNSIPSRFNVETNAGNNALKFKNSSTNGSMIWESPFIKNPKDIIFVMNNTVKNNYCIPINYKLYDENFNDITSQIVTTNSSAASMYLMTTTKAAYNNGTEGSYMSTNQNIIGISNINDNDTTADDSTTIDNNYILVIPSASYWTGGLVSDTLLNSIKYVKFLIRNSTYYHSENTEVMSLSCSIYNIKDIQDREHYYPTN